MKRKNSYRNPYDRLHEPPAGPKVSTHAAADVLCILIAVALAYAAWVMTP